MKWSKLKQRLEERFAPELGKRVNIHLTRYRQAHDDEGELIVTLDGAKIFGAAYYTYLEERISLEARAKNEDADSGLGSMELDRQLAAAGIAPERLLAGAAFLSLSQSIEDMLASVHPFIRGLAVIDARCGKRRLQKIDPTSEHPFVARLHALRRAERF